MKKFLSIFLCCFLVFNSVVVPASAVKAEEVAVFEDAEGNEVRVLSYGVAPANAAAGVLYLTSTGGSMGAGVASIASAALPVLGYVLAAGVIVYSVYGLASCVMNMYDSLSSDARNELAQIEASGTESYTLSDYPALSSELSGVMGNVVSGSIILNEFDRSAFGTFDYSIHQFNNSQVMPEAFNILLSAEPTPIEGTPLYVSRVKAPYNDAMRVLKITNSSTGISLYLADMSDTSFNSKSIDFYFSAPVYTNYVNADGIEQYWYFYFPVAYQLSGYSLYSSMTFSEYNSGSVANPVYLYFEGTGDSRLDNVLFRAQNMYNGVSTLTPYESLHPGMDEVTINGSAASIVLGNGIANVGATSTPAIPEENKPIYLPPSVALDNANTLTQSGALTGTWDTTIDGEKVEVENPDIGVDTEVGFWESILNWLESFWDKFVSMLQAALMGLFVPSEGFFEQFIADISATFEDRMGILTYPISLIYDFCGHMMDIGEEEPVFRWPSWSYKGTPFLPAGSFNFNDILSNGTFKMLHDVYLLIVDAGIVFGLLHLAQKKYDSIINH